MDAPAMLTNKHVPEDIGLRHNAAGEEGGQQQLHRDEKQHKQPVLKKVKDKVKKIKNTIAGHGNGGEHGAGERVGGDISSSSSSEEEEEVAMRGPEVETGGYREDVEDKPVVTDSDPELHGAPMYDSERAPAAKEVKRDDSPGVRLGELGTPVVEDPAAPQSTTPAPRGGEDIGTTPVVRAFESMTVSDDLPHVGAGKMDVDERSEAMPVSSDAGVEEFKDAPTDAAPGGAAAPTYTEKIKSAATGTTEYGKMLASTVYEKVAGVGTAVASKVQQTTQSTGTATPGADAQGSARDAPVATDAATPGAGGGQDKGVTVTGYIAEKLRPGDEDRALSEAISGAVQRRKEDAGSTAAQAGSAVSQRVPAPGQVLAMAREAPAQVMTKARETVTSLTGGNRASETVQPTTEGNARVAEGGGVAEAPVLRGEEIGAGRDDAAIPNASMT